MWNSNSVIAWLVARAGLDAEAIQPPTRGRAPGWNAGLEVARRQEVHTRAQVAATAPIPSPISARTSALRHTHPPMKCAAAAKPG
jgi:hypothetical protein